MNINVVKKIILFLIIVLLIVTIIIIKLYSNINIETLEETVPSGEKFEETYGKNQSGGIDYQSYFDIKTNIQKYINTTNIKDLQYGYYDENKNYISTSNQNEIKQKVYNLLSNKYINENNLTIENLQDKIKFINVPTVFVPIEISLIQDGEIKTFLVHGLVESLENYSVINNMFAIINMNLRESIFSIEPLSGEYNSISEIKVEKQEDTIIANEDNRLDSRFIDNGDIPAEYINIYKGLALGAPEKLYDLLDENYRKLKFGNLEEFKNYINKNKAQIITTNLDKFQIEVNDNKVRYVCVDTNGKYYVINQNEALADYTMMLDIYTTDLPDFREKYTKSTDNQKVSLNIQKLVQATNDGDYKYVYNKLDDTFKAENFPTQQDFENFIKQKYNENQTITYEKYEEVAGVHVYEIKVTDTKNNNTINANVVMQLETGRNFVFSFGILN